MNILIVYAHPWEKSYNHAILQSVINGLKFNNHNIEIIDLYKDKFNPVFKKDEMAIYRKGEFIDKIIGKYQKKIKSHDYLFFIFPIWWGTMPAILKGFFDKVFLPQWAYKVDSKAIIHGMLNNIKGCTIITTMNGPNIFYSLVLKNPIKQVLIKDTLKLSGINKNKLLQLGNIRNASEAKRKKWLSNIENYAKRIKIIL